LIFFFVNKLINKKTENGKKGKCFVKPNEALQKKKGKLKNA
jgi:hypothetical protein